MLFHRHLALGRISYLAGISCTAIGVVLTHFSLGLLVAATLALVALTAGRGTGFFKNLARVVRAFAREEDGCALGVLLSLAARC